MVIELFPTTIMWDPLDVPETGDIPFTDYSRWRLTADDQGRHIWDYLPSDEACQAWPQNVLDKAMLGLPTVRHQVIASRISC